MTHLSVNVNKIALLRNSRGRDFPSVEWFSRNCLKMGAQGITLHPRPDQRHARYSDVTKLLAVVGEFPGAELNVEGNPTREFLDVVIAAQPHQCTLVPDAPGQLTSDHGWDLRGEAHRLRAIVGELKAAGVRTSLFVDHDSPDIPLAKDLGADRVELYTEPYAENFDRPDRIKVRDAFARSAEVAQRAGLGVNAGHDLNLANLSLFLEIPGILEVSIGHALIVECLEQGLDSVIGAYLENHFARPMIGKPFIDPSRWAAVRLFAMDVDGILTDGVISVSSDGTESKNFSIIDGLGLKRLEKAGIITAWISGRLSGATTVRATELKIPHLIQGRIDKITALRELADQLKLGAESCVYMGDDDIDAAALSWAGIGVSVPDAMPAALEAADYLTTRRAGHGAVREVCEHLLAAHPVAKTS